MVLMTGCDCAGYICVGSESGGDGGADVACSRLVMDDGNDDDDGWVWY